MLINYVKGVSFKCMIEWLKLLKVKWEIQIKNEERQNVAFIRDDKWNNSTSSVQLEICFHSRSIPYS